MFALRISARARTELRAIRRYIADTSGQREIAETFTDRLIFQCERLASMPFEMGTARPELGAGIRSFPYGNYVIFFRYREHRMEIISIIEGHRDIDALFTTETE